MREYTVGVTPDLNFVSEGLIHPDAEAPRPINYGLCAEAADCEVQVVNHESWPETPINHEASYRDHVLELVPRWLRLYKRRMRGSWSGSYIALFLQTVASVGFAHMFGTLLDSTHKDDFLGSNYVFIIGMAVFSLCAVFGRVLLSVHQPDATSVLRSDIVAKWLTLTPDQTKLIGESAFKDALDVDAPKLTELVIQPILSVAATAMLFWVGVLYTVALCLAQWAESWLVLVYLVPVGVAMLLSCGVIWDRLQRHEPVAADKLTAEEATFEAFDHAVSAKRCASELFVRGDAGPEQRLQRSYETCSGTHQVKISDVRVHSADTTAAVMLLLLIGAVFVGQEVGDTEKVLRIHTFRKIFSLPYSLLSVGM